MNALGFLLIGLVVSFNFIVLIAKYRKHRYADMLLDTAIFVCISLLFCGSFSALVVGTIASMCVSIYLYFRPITFRDLIPNDEEEEDDEYEYEYE